MNFILLQSAPQSGFLGGLFPVVLIIVVFYFFMIRPQLKKQKEENKFKSELKRGDRIVTTGGIHGKIADLRENTVIIEVEGGNRLKIEKTSISKDFSAQYQKKD